MLSDLADHMGVTVATMSLAIDRKAFNTILMEGLALVGGAMLPKPAGEWGMPPEMVTSLTGYGPDADKNVAEAHAFIDYMLRPDVQKLLAEGVWYSPANKKVKLDAKYDAKLLTTEAKVATLIQPDWKWYNARKDEIDSRVNRIFRA